MKVAAIECHVLINFAVRLLTVLTVGWVLTDQMVLAQYAATVLADRPVAYYRLDESPGSTVAIDSSGNGNNGFYEGNPKLGVAGLIAGSDTAFDSTTGNVMIPNTPELNFVSIPYTLEAWLKGTPLSTVMGGRIFDKALAGSDMGYGYDVELNYVRMFGTNPPGNFDTITPLPSNTANHVVVVSNGKGTGLIYVNGTLVASGAQIASQTYTGPAHIGVASDGTAPFTGIIDEVAVYNYALSASRILAHYKAGGTGGGDCATEVTTEVIISALSIYGVPPFRGLYEQTIQIRNGSKPLQGPLSFVLHGIPSSTTSIASAPDALRSTHCFSNTQDGDTYFLIDSLLPTANDDVLKPNELLQFTLVYASGTNWPTMFTPKLLMGIPNK